MKPFTSKEILGAYDYAAAGGQALHVVHYSGGIYHNAPACFKGTQSFGHLIDADKDRLIATAKRLGVRRIVVSREGQRGQHVDLCGKPLERALELVDTNEGK